VEGAKGHLVIPAGVDDLVDQALRINVEPLLILDYGNQYYDGGRKPASPEALSAFARYAVFVVQHFKGKVHLYEVWNEWDDTAGGTSPGTPQAYVRLLKAVYPTAKAADPSALFLAGAVSAGGLNWLSGMLAAGGAGFFDGISTHTYNFSKHDRTPDGWAADLLATEGVIHRYTGGHDLPLYVSEMGWPSYSGPGGSSPKEAAIFIAQMFLLARTMSFLRGIWWYDLCDDGADTTKLGDTFGLVDVNLIPKPAFAALAAVAPVVREASGVERLNAGNPSLHALKFRHNGDTQVLALWNAGETSPVRVHVSGSTPLQVLSTESDDPGANLNKTSAKDLTIGISSSPMLISGTHLTLSIPK
jgi:hypothetical protein